MQAVFFEFLRPSLRALAVVCLATGLLGVAPLHAGELEPRSFDPQAGLSLLSEVALKEMGPVSNSALRAEDARDEQDREVLAEWLGAGGPLPHPLLARLTVEDREAYGDLLLSGDPVPTSVLGELAGLRRLFEKKARVGLAISALTERPRQANLTPTNSGSWEDLTGGGQIWRLRVRSEEAWWLVLGFRTFNPLPGAQLHIYDVHRETVLGPFTTKNIESHRQLWTPPIDGQEVVIELFWPEGLRGIDPEITLSTVSHGYKNAWAQAPAIVEPEGDETIVAGASGSCNVNVACEPEWNDETRGVMRLLVGGQWLCSASLVNNMDENCTPYVLTANHCVGNTSEAAGTNFLFNYEREECSGGSAPTNQSRTGSTLRATRSTTDFSLVEMTNDPPADFGVYFNGWDRDPTPAPEGTCIHHPSGDVKKISHEYSSLIVAPNQNFWRVIDWDSGTTEGGSSGSPLFNSTDPVGDEPLIVGFLSSGLASCSNNLYDQYGRFDRSWAGGGTSGTGLRDWLDPLGENPITLGGLDHDVCLNPGPNFRVVDLAVQDYRGNGNGFADPGESIVLQVTVENNGHSTAELVSGVLSSPSVQLGVARPTGSWPDLAVGASANSDAPHFDVQIDPSVACDLFGQTVPLTLTMTYDDATGPIQADFEMTVGEPNLIEVFEDDLEPSSQPGWVFFAGTWRLLNSSNPDQYSSPSHSFYTANSNSATQAQLRMPQQPGGGGTLPVNSRMRFQTSFLTEADRDGGVLEYSLDGGANWFDINWDLGSGQEVDRFLANGYTGNVASANRQGWEGDSGGWVQVEVDLTDFAGEELDLRFIFISGNGHIGDPVDGWYIDDVVVDAVQYDCEVLAEAPGEVLELRLNKGLFGTTSVEWQAPANGGAILRYLLQETPLGPLEPSFRRDLGAQTSVLVPSGLLGADRGFLVVGENSLGIGTTGDDSEGDPRPPAEPAP